MHLSSALATFSFSDFSALAAFIASLDAREKRPAANVITLSGAVARDDSGEAEAFKAAMAKVATARRGNGITLPDAVAAPAVTRSSARALTAGETTLPKLKVDWALWCAARGLRVFPAKWESPSRKKPIIEGWQYLATVEPAQITEWWAKWPDADIGIALGQGILVIDIDVKNGKPGLKSLAKLGIALDDTLCSVTWSGGYHQFYADPDAYMNTVGFLPGLDCKSKGGMVLGPGSFRGLYKLLHEKPIAPLPEALKRHLTTGQGYTAT